VSAADTFVKRHLGPRAEDVRAMLDTVGYPTLDAFIDAVVPADIRLRKPLALPPASAERDALEELASLAARNQVFRSYLGMGYHDTVTPPVILRNILENPGWYTAYTPYQAEIAQGRLEALLNYQTMVADLTGLEIANASLLDEATAAAEAMHLTHAASKVGASPVYLVDELCHPQTIAVVRTRAEAQGVEIVVGDPGGFAFGGNVIGALVQYPATDGVVRDFRALCERAHAAGALVAAATDLLALALLAPPAEWGADIAVGNTQRFGVPLGYGGPHAAFFATRDQYKRLLPGRIIGVSRDRAGRPGLRMALGTREQHIRRDKATSNICTNQGLMAVAATIYLSTLGKNGLRRVAELCWHKSHYAAQAIGRLPGFSVDTSKPFFKEFVVRCPKPVKDLNLRLMDDWGIIGGYDLGRDYAHRKDHMLVCVTEVNSKEEIDEFVEALGEINK
jgi:glycine dehydrogenase